MHPVFLEGAAGQIVVCVLCPCRDKKPLSGGGGVFFPLYLDDAGAAGNKVKFILGKVMGVYGPDIVRRAKKLTAGVADSVQVGKIYFLQTFHFYTPLKIDKFMLVPAIP
jgi:hypothetical protein